MIESDSGDFSALISRLNQSEKYQEEEKQFDIIRKDAIKKKQKKELIHEEDNESFDNENNDEDDNNDDEVLQNLDLELEYEDDDENISSYKKNNQQKNLNKNINCIITELYNDLEDYSWPSLWKLTDQYMSKNYTELISIVSSPELIHAGILNKYVAYNIETKSKLYCESPSNKLSAPATICESALFSPNITLSYRVKRRFSDFQWLHSTLSERYLGLVLPPLPSVENLQKKGIKFLLGGESNKNCNSQYIKSRTVQLHLFLSRLLKIPFLVQDGTLMAFLSIENYKEFKDYTHLQSESKSMRSLLNLQNDGLILWNCLLNRLHFESFGLTKGMLEYKMKYVSKREDYLMISSRREQREYEMSMEKEREEEKIDPIEREVKIEIDKSVELEKKNEENARVAEAEADLQDLDLLEVLLNDLFSSILAINKEKIDNLLQHSLSLEKDAKLLIKQFLDFLKNYDGMNESIYKILQVELMYDSNIGKIMNENNIGDQKSESDGKKRENISRELTENLNELVLKKKEWKNNLIVIMKFYQLVFLSYLQFYIGQLGQFKEVLQSYVSKVKNLDRICKEKKKLKEEKEKVSKNKGLGDIDNIPSFSNTSTSSSTHNFFVHNNKETSVASNNSSNTKPSIFFRQPNDFEHLLKEKDIVLQNHVHLLIMSTKAFFFSELERFEWEKKFIFEKINDFMNKISLSLAKLYISNSTNPSYLSNITIKNDSELVEVQEDNESDKIHESIIKYKNYFNFDDSEILKRVMVEEVGDEDHEEIS